MTYKNFTLDIDKAGIVLASINVPDQSMNVWTADFISECTAFIEDFISNDAMKGLVWTSSRDNAFLAGADLRMIEGRSGELSKEAFENEGMALTRLFRRMETSGHSPRAMAREGKKAKPVAAAINGLALGGGLELCLACHYRVAENNPRIQLGLPEVLVGLLPGAGGTQRSLRLIGLQNAAKMCGQGRSVSPQAALEQGLIHEISEVGSSVQAAKDWISQNLEGVLAPWDKKGFKIPGGAGAMNPNSGNFFVVANAMSRAETNDNYPATKAIMSCLWEGGIVPIDTALAIEVKYIIQLITDPVSKNMIRTLFINKGAAEKGAARPKGIDKVDIKKVGVLGAGLMGAGIAHVTAKAGMQVVSLDRSLDEARKAVAYTAKILNKSVAKGRMTQEKADAFLARITPTDDYNDLQDVDLIIEAVFERPDVKADVIKKTEAVIGKHVVFASNTSTLPIGGLAENSVRPENFIGLHFFSPVERMPLLEIIPHEGTSDQALAVAFDYNRKIKKTPIVVKDVRGFFTNQVFPPYINESMLMIMEGVKPALIENCAINLGLPIGPLAVQDETTFKLGYDVMKSTQEALGSDYVKMGTEDLYELMTLKLKRIGRRVGAGIYNYSEDGKRLGLWQGIHEHYPLAKDQPDAAEVTQRLLYAQLTPTAQCYADGVVADPQSADLGAIFGWGFPAWTGGPLSHIDTLGLDTYVETSDNLAQRFGARFTPPQRLRDMAKKGETLYGTAKPANVKKTA